MTWFCSVLFSCSQIIPRFVSFSAEAVFSLVFTLRHCLAAWVFGADECRRGLILRARLYAATHAKRDREGFCQRGRRLRSHKRLNLLATSPDTRLATRMGKEDRLRRLYTTERPSLIRLAIRKYWSVLHLGLRVSGVPDVCGAFGWRVLGEDFAAGVGDRFVASRSDLAQQSFELGEDLLDWVEVG
jgi:hypothetical protein